MRITKLTLENFRSFKDKQTIEFAPVTLLFGPNSVGKSTILMALFYLHHILTKSDCNPLRLEALGNKYVGGFKGLVNGRNLNETIKIGVEYSKENLIGSSYTEMRDLLEEDELQDIEWLFNLADASGSIDTVEIELSIEWSKQSKQAFVSECLIKLDKQEFATLKSSTGKKQAFIESINYLHPLLVGDEHDDWLEQCFDNGSVHSRNVKKALELKGHQLLDTDVEVDDSDHEDLHPKLIDAFYELMPVIEDKTFATVFHEAINVQRIPESEFNNSSFMSVAEATMFMHAPIAYESSIGCIPVLRKLLTTSLDFDDKKAGALIREVLSDAIVPVFDNLCTLLDDSLCIGPLRAIPDPTYQANPSPRAEDWYEGLAAWDYLESADLSMLKKIDHWMRKELVLGYGLSLKFEKAFFDFNKCSDFTSIKDLDRQLNASITHTLTSDKHEQSLFKINEQETKLKYTLWDDKSQIDVHGCDVGAGVSQVLPLIVASASRDKGLVAIEQPELHVHPRVQVGIGDLLTQANSKIGFLVETHSEHIVLRLLKRIRQTSDDELPKGIKSVTKDSVSIVYLDISDSGVKAQRIHIDEEGEFVERWPQGFFAERREELL